MLTGIFVIFLIVFTGYQHLLLMELNERVNAVEGLEKINADTIHRLFNLYERLADR